MPRTFALITLLLLALPPLAYGQGNPFGEILNGIMRGAAQDNARKKAEAEWSQIDSTLLECLNRNITPPPRQLATEGIPPSDPRIAPFIQRCRQQFAAEEQQRQRAALEQQRRDAQVRREELARQEDIRRREENDRRKREQAEREQQRREEIARKEEEARQETARQNEETARKLREEMGTLRLLPVAESLGTPDSVTLFITSRDTPTLSRDLSGRPVFAQAPIVCIPNNGPLSPDPAFLSYTRDQVRLLLGTGFRERACAYPDLVTQEVVLLAASQFNTASPDAQLNFLRGLRDKKLLPLKTINPADFAALQQKQREAVIAIERQLENNANIYALLHRSAPVRALCQISGDTADALLAVYRNKASEWATVMPSAGLSVRSTTTLEDTFLMLKRGECDAVFISSNVAQTLLPAVRRDNLQLTLHASVIDGESVAAEQAEIVTRKANAERLKQEEEQRRQEEARRYEEERRKAEQLRERCVSKDMARNYFVSACVASGLENKPGDALSTARKDAEAELTKLSECPSEIKGAVFRSAASAGVSARASVSPLVVYHEGLLAQCRKQADLQLK